jgi:hypothetical protein
MAEAGLKRNLQYYSICAEMPARYAKPSERILQVQANVATVLLPIVVVAQLGYLCKFL